MEHASGMGDRRRRLWIGTERQWRYARVPLSEQEARILQYLGAAVLLRWNDLPMHIQRELFQHSLVDVEPCKLTMLKGDRPLPSCAQGRQ